MKTTIFITCLITVALIYRCGNNSDSSDSTCTIRQIPKDSLVDYTNMVPLDTAIRDISNYVRMAESLFLEGGGSPDSIIRSYTIGKADLMGVLGMEVSDTGVFRYDNCRVYIGLRATGIKSINTIGKIVDTIYTYEYKLYMTPVDSIGDDVFYNKSSSIAGKATKNSYVLDLITPCPKTCDEESPLYTLIPLK